MFTGIVQFTAPIIDLQLIDGLMHISIVFPDEYLKPLKTGASVSINGTCLTVASITNNLVKFDIVKETLNITNLSKLNVGDYVNLESSLKLGDEIGGHLLSGHIDTTALIDSVTRDQHNCYFTFVLDRKWDPYIFPKGFIAVNGASLTIATVIKEESLKFTIWLIPETLKRTTFGRLSTGDVVNIEIDRNTQTIVDTVNRYLKENISIT
jgi:riboflavin synthase